jgi:hypothetical protein
MIRFQIYNPPYAQASIVSCELLGELETDTVAKAKRHLVLLRSNLKMPRLFLRYFSPKLDRYMLVD